jgi:hypothetical protein
MRARCTECRRRFEAAASARATQRVCGAACRALRDRKLARARRRRELEDARADERERQRTSRSRRRAPARRDDSPQDPEYGLSRTQVSQLVDRVLALSRASLVRDFEGALRSYAALRQEARSPG